MSIWGSHYTIKDDDPINGDFLDVAFTRMDPDGHECRVISNGVYLKREQIEELRDTLNEWLRA